MTPGAADTAALSQAYSAGRHIPAAAVGTVRSGTARIADDTATGTEWAVANFLPAGSASAQEKIDFQDGASKGLFEKPAGGSWQLVQSATVLACSDTVPAAVKTSLGLDTSAASCDAGSARPSAAVKSAAAKPQTLTSDIASIALSQVGEATTPAESSFSGVDCDPYSTLDAAFSPNADGCGSDASHQVENQNESWCSDFAKWVWAQAGVTADYNTLNAGSVSFYQWALDQGESPAADTGTPAVGDAIVFFPAGTVSASTFADHVGIVVSVNADGTIDMVNGDFLGSTGITAEYDTEISLTTWAAGVWGAGEQWVLVNPIAAAHPAPTAAIVAPTTATAGTSVNLAGIAAEQGGSISSYYWTFDDGRNNNVTAQTTSHVFQRAGLYTVTLTATSNFGTATVKTWNIGVSAASSAVSSVPNNSVWYTTEPVMQYEFTESASGALEVDSWDGASWLQQTEPGTPEAGADLAGLTYADPASADATVPHAYYRAADGTLGESYLGANGWTTATLAGTPAAGSAVAALAADPANGIKPGLSVTPSAFFFDGSGKLNVASESGTAWSDTALSGPATQTPGSLATTTAALPVAAEYAFYVSASGKLTADSNLLGSWSSLQIPNSLGVKAGTALAAATTNTGVDVFFIDAAGNLAVADSLVPGIWSVREIPGAPVQGTTLTATNDLGSTGTVGDEVFYTTSGGAPAVTGHSGTAAWSATALPGTATAIDAASGDIVPGQPQQVFLADGSQLGVDTSTAPGSAWSYSALPSTPTTYPGTVLLYAATSADGTTALNAAAYAGLPADQVTTSFADAWAATLSGNYLVIAVGQAAVNALYDNPCGWVNPSQDDPGSTPFGNVNRPLNVTLTNLFLVGAAATASQTPQRVDDMAYYAVHGALPAGATLPSVAGPGFSCLGSAS
ncbi:MAG TPA: PKD domain-containing protein [Actinocrinis sp.]